MTTLKVWPTFHHLDDANIGDIVACIVAVRLKVDPPRRLDERRAENHWPDLMRDPRQLHAVHVDIDGQRYRLRKDLAGT